MPFFVPVVYVVVEVAAVAGPAAVVAMRAAPAVMPRIQASAGHAAAAAQRLGPALSAQGARLMQGLRGSWTAVEKTMQHLFRSLNAVATHVAEVGEVQAVRVVQNGKEFVVFASTNKAQAMLAAQRVASGGTGRVVGQVEAGVGQATANNVVKAAHNAIYAAF